MGREYHISSDSEAALDGLATGFLKRSQPIHMHTYAMFSAEDGRDAGEWTTEGSLREMQPRLMAHISRMASVASQLHHQAAKGKEGVHVTRIATPEFALYTRRLLNEREFDEVKQHIMKVMSGLPDTVHLSLNTFSVNIGGKLKNIGLYVQGGEPPALHIIAKRVVAPVDPTFAGVEVDSDVAIDLGNAPFVVSTGGASYIQQVDICADHGEGSSAHQLALMAGELPAQSNLLLSSSTIEHIPSMSATESVTHVDDDLGANSVFFHEGEDIALDDDPRFGAAWTLRAFPEQTVGCLKKAYDVERRSKNQEALAKRLGEPVDEAFLVAHIQRAVATENWERLNFLLDHTAICPKECLPLLLDNVSHLMVAGKNLLAENMNALGVEGRLRLMDSSRPMSDELFDRLFSQVLNVDKRAKIDFFFDNIDRLNKKTLLTLISRVERIPDDKLDGLGRRLLEAIDIEGPSGHTGGVVVAINALLSRPEKLSASLVNAFAVQCDRLTKVLMGEEGVSAEDSKDALISAASILKKCGSNSDNKQLGFAIETLLADGVTLSDADKAMIVEALTNSYFSDTAIAGMASHVSDLSDSALYVLVENFYRLDSSKQQQAVIDNAEGMKDIDWLCKLYQEARSQNEEGLTHFELTGLKDHIIMRIDESLMLLKSGVPADNAEVNEAFSGGSRLDQVRAVLHVYQQNTTLLSDDAPAQKAAMDQFNVVIDSLFENPDILTLLSTADSGLHEEAATGAESTRARMEALKAAAGRVPSPDDAALEAELAGRTPSEVVAFDPDRLDEVASDSESVSESVESPDGTKPAGGAGAGDDDVTATITRGGP